MELNADQLHMLRHMLGINTPTHRRPRPYRNHAAVIPGDPRFLALEAAGAVARCRRAGDAPGFEYDYYACTPAGREAAMRSHRDIRFPKKKHTYARYLSLRDALPDLSFREFLVDPDYSDIRKEA